ncbi:MAG: DUF4249 domain-containing protein [Cyclobacteriaceae bacterium]
MKKIFLLIIILSAFSCETVIYPELNDAAEIIVVDAWLVHNKPTQEIRLTRSQPYFDNTEPQMITGAEVTVLDIETGLLYEFQEGEKSYRWTADSTFGVIGHNYRLTVDVEGETFEATARLGRVPQVDSVVFRHNPKDYDILEPYFTAEFFATDPAGLGDAYWIKAWKNGVFLNKPSEINIAFDGGFGEGQEVDGVVLHKTVRKDYLNPMEERTDRKNYYYPPYDLGDSIYVEIHSIDPAAYDYLSVVKTQTDREGGFAELFAIPLANVTTNLRSTDPLSATPIGGFFNVSAVASNGSRLTEEIVSKFQ